MDWEETPTIQNHQSLHTPMPEWVNGREWAWPYWKFGFKSGGVLFTELHAEFNSIKCAIQDPYGWHLDVCDVANIADTREEFCNLLRQRQNERFTELRKTWDTTRTRLIADPKRWDIPPAARDLWVNFVRISRNFSYDSFVGYFGAYIKDTSEPTAVLADNQVSTREDQRQQQQQKEAEDGGENKTDTQEEEREQSRPTLERPESGPERTGERSAARLSGQAVMKPNKVVKRQRRTGKGDAHNHGGLRRSARLKQKYAEAGDHAGKV
ncbi:hypothetical protein FHL15_007043 [Xylaria flabelliformis]|uniref:Uncharacterized protein n=1 Tax=Xylaria flabelliformis TaxID=2512241 RepID=A0A553HW39_9PEZI|nr:hypothetical protein FHL15_007043 [Xylaria flabelliformis]